MRPRRHRDEVRVVVRVDRVQERLELGSVLGLLAKVDNVDGDRVLLELLAELDEVLLLLLDRAAHEDDDALPLVLVLPVLEREAGDLKARRQHDLAAELRAVRLREHLADVARHRDADLDARARHREHADRVLGV